MDVGRRTKDAQLGGVKAVASQQLKRRLVAEVAARCGVVQHGGMLDSKAPVRLAQPGCKEESPCCLEEGAEEPLHHPVLCLRVRRGEALLDLEVEAGVGELLALEDGVAVCLQHGAAQPVAHVAVLAQLVERSHSIALLLDEVGPGEAGGVVHEGDGVACATQGRHLQWASDVGVDQLAWRSCPWSRLLWDRSACALAEHAGLAVHGVAAGPGSDLLPQGSNAAGVSRVVAVPKQLVHAVALVALAVLVVIVVVVVVVSVAVHAVALIVVVVTGGALPRTESSRESWRDSAVEVEVAVVVGRHEGHAPAPKGDGALLVLDDDVGVLAGLCDEVEGQQVVGDGWHMQHVAQDDGAALAIGAGDVEDGSAFANDVGRLIVGNLDGLLGCDVLLQQ